MRTGPRRAPLVVGLVLSAVVHGVLLGVRVPLRQPSGLQASPERGYAPRIVIPLLPRVVPREPGGSEELSTREVETGPAGRAELVPATEPSRPSQPSTFGGPVDPRLASPVVLPLKPSVAEGTASLGRRVDSANAEVSALASSRRLLSPGARWGFDNGRLLLGGRSLTVCTAASSETACGIAGRGDALGERLRQFTEIERQAALGAVRRSWEERAREIRRRADSIADTLR